MRRGDADVARRVIDLAGMDHSLLEAGRRLQLFQIIWRVDDHLHADACLLHLAQPLCEERHMEDHDHVALHQCIQRPLALANGGHAHLGPAGDHVDAHLVDVEAHLVCGGKGGLNVLSARAKVGYDRHGLTGADLAQLELLAKQRSQLGRVHFLSADSSLHRCLHDEAIGCT